MGEGNRREWLLFCHYESIIIITIIILINNNNDDDNNNDNNDIIFWNSIYALTQFGPLKKIANSTMPPSFICVL